MRLLLRITLACFAIGIIFCACVALWFFAYDGDLPDTRVLSAFAPVQPTQVSDRCLPGASTAIPYELIGDHLLAALSAVEVREQDPTALASEYGVFTNPASPHTATLSLQISRTMFCQPSKQLNRELNELRAAVQLDRRFSRRQLFTIYTNRLWFGNDLIGIQAASQHFFGKEPNQLSTGEAALLAGLVRSPRRFSPIHHPDQAHQRRNEVLDAMVATGAISREEGTAAKASELRVLAN